MKKKEIIIESRRDLEDTKKAIDEAYTELIDPFLLIIQHLHSEFPDLKKSLDDYEVSTIQKFSKNLEPHEKRVIYDMLKRFEKYHKNIIEGTKKIIDRRK